MFWQDVQQVSFYGDLDNVRMFWFRIETDKSSWAGVELVQVHYVAASKHSAVSEVRSTGIQFASVQNIQKQSLQF